MFILVDERLTGISALTREYMNAFTNIRIHQTNYILLASNLRTELFVCLFVCLFVVRGLGKSLGTLFIRRMGLTTLHEFQ